MKKKIGIKDILLLQLVIIIYTGSSVTAKFATGTKLFSLQFILLYGLDVLILGIYALLWQQMIKKFDLSVAYANRSMALMWSALWAVLLFGETLGFKQVFGILLVVAGTVIVNSDGRKEKEHA